MKHFLLICIFFIMQILETSAQQINNSGMENWQTFANYDVPDSFYTHDQIFFFGTATTLKTTDAHSGQFAALIKTIQGPSTTNFSGNLSYGSFLLGLTNYFYGWPFTMRPAKLKFWYKYINASNDSAFAGIALSKWTGTNTTVGLGLLYLTSNTPNYTLGEIPIGYSSGLIPDSLNLGFISSFNSTPTAGTMLYVDDISLEYTTDVNDISTQIGFSVYPNPCSRYLFIEPKDVNKFDLVITDAFGKKVYQVENANGRLLVDCLSFAKGIYSIHVKSDFMNYAYKLVKQD